MQLKAHAKINLTLDVGRLRDDGFHEVSMVMQEISLHDTVTLSFSGVELPRLICHQEGIPTDESNLCLKAAEAFSNSIGGPLHGLVITLDKRIPTMAGLGGGSADAAAVLHGLNRIGGGDVLPHFEQPHLRAVPLVQLTYIGSRVGSDVPFCVVGGTALAEGRGEMVTRLPSLPRCGLVLIQPDFQISTAALFSAIDSVNIPPRPVTDTQDLIVAIEAGDLPRVGKLLYNAFEQVLPPSQRFTVEQIKTQLRGSGAFGASMTGTGSVVYGIFPDKAAARRVAAELTGQYPFVTACTAGE